MPRPSFVHRIVLLVLCTTLTLPLAAVAAPGLGGESSWSPRNPAQVFLDWVRLRLDLLNKNGCQVDPNGYLIGTCPREPKPSSNNKNGCSADPDGRPSR